MTERERSLQHQLRQMQQKDAATLHNLLEEGSLLHKQLEEKCAQSERDIHAARELLEQQKAQMLVVFSY